MILRLIPVVILLGEALCFAQHATPLVPMNAATEAHLQNEIPTLMEKSGVPGLSIAVIRDGKTVWAASYGVRNAETRKPVTEGTLFNVGSLSKPVFAYGVLKLVDAGKLKLDESLAPYLPKESIAGDSRFNQITARFVLSHRTGFPNWRQTVNLSPFTSLPEKDSVIPAPAWFFYRDLSRKSRASRSTTTCRRRSLDLWV